MPISEIGTARLAITVARRLCRKTKITSTTSTTASTQLDLDVLDRGADAGGAVGQHVDLAAIAGSAACSSGSCFLIASTVRDHVGARLALHVEDDRRAQLAAPAGPGAEPRVLGALDHLRDVDQAHRRAVLVGDDQVLVVVGGEQLVVGVDRVGALRAVEAALGAVGVGRRDRGAQRVEADAVRRQRLGVGLDAHRRPLAAATSVTRPTPETWLIFCASRVLTRFCTSVSGMVSDVIASVSTGASAGLTLA